MRARADLIVSNGIENPSPCAIGIIAVVIPTTRPVLSTRGPPEFPGLIDVSVWMRSVIFRVSGACSVRPSALTTPAVTVQFKPYGLPTAMPICQRHLHPPCIGNHVGISQNLSIRGKDETRAYTTIFPRHIVLAIAPSLMLQVYTYDRRPNAFRRRHYRT